MFVTTQDKYAVLLNNSSCSSLSLSLHSTIIFFIPLEYIRKRYDFVVEAMCKVNSRYDEIMLRSKAFKVRV